ncbi:hypothetical protein Bbelb_162420 [Branchiostoma belcheri]|nr:hypothetical protein Bbelb_162420 [Branchiostoma belcheri]
MGFEPVTVVSRTHRGPTLSYHPTLTYDYKKPLGVFSTVCELLATTKFWGHTETLLSLCTLLLNPPPHKHTHGTSCLLAVAGASVKFKLHTGKHALGVRMFLAVLTNNVLSGLNSAHGNPLVPLPEGGAALTMAVPSTGRLTQKGPAVKPVGDYLTRTGCGRPPDCEMTTTDELGSAFWSFYHRGLF